MEIQDEFKAIVKYIHQLPSEGQVKGNYKPSVERKLRFYALYKQATIGKCNVSQPAFYNITARAKWTVWDSLGDMSREEAMELYIKEFKKDLIKHADCVPLPYVYNAKC